MKYKVCVHWDQMNIWEVDADSEEEALTLAVSGDGNLVTEDWDLTDAHIDYD